MLLLASLIGLCALMFWAGFLCAPHPGQYRSRAGFVTTLALVIFAAYFQIRESRTLDELGELVALPPSVDEVRYVPTAEEAVGMARALAAAPRGRFAGEASGERAAFAEHAAADRVDHWILYSPLAAEMVVAFHRRSAAQHGWKVGGGSASQIVLLRPGERLSITALPRRTGSGSRVVYAHSPAPP
jgi:hypothetical protein